MSARNPRERLKLARLAGAALVIALAYLAWDRIALERQLRTPEYLARRANQLQEGTDVARHAQMVLEARQLAREELVRLESLGRRTEKQLNLLAEAVPKSAAKLQKLRDTPAGNSLAAHPDSLEQFVALTTEYVPEPDAVLDLQKRFDLLFQAVTQALAAPTTEKPPEPTLATRLQAINDETEKWVVQNAAFDRRLAALVEAAPPAPGDSGPSLAAAVEQHQDAWAAQLNRAAQTAAEKVRQEFAAEHEAEKLKTQRELEEAKLAKERKIRDEQVKAEQLEAEIESRKIAEATEAARREEERRVTEHEAALLRAAEEQAFQDALPEIRKYLSGVITPGHQQLGRGGWDFTEELKPLSLSALKVRRAMERSTTGQFHFAGNVGSSKNDRPKGFLDGHLGGHVDPTVVPDVVKAQSLLEKHADKLIEKGMLLP